MQGIVFKQEFIAPIRNGEKTQTRRDWDGCVPGVESGRALAVLESFMQPREDAPCYIHVQDVRRERLSAMTEDDAAAEGNYTLDEFKQTWCDIYEEWDDEQTVFVIEFEYAGDDFESAAGNAVLSDFSG